MKIDRLGILILILMMLMCGSLGMESFASEKTVILKDVRAEISRKFSKAEGLPDEDCLAIALDEKGQVVVETKGGFAAFQDGHWKKLDEAPPVFTQKGHLKKRVAGALKVDEKNIRDIAQGPGEQIAVALERGMMIKSQGSDWERAHPRAGHHSWSPVDVRAVGYSADGTLWFACLQGVGYQKNGEWTLHPVCEGLPYNDFTSLAAGPDGEVYFGTTEGAIRFDGTTWEYREGPRWLPDNDIRGVVVDKDGTSWFATAKGVGCIEQPLMKLSEKARKLEEDIDKHHRRTLYGYVIGAHLKNPGDRSEWSNEDNDNDGLWTGMYGAGECFAYGATNDPYHKERAKKAFEALRFLSQVTQGGEHPAPRGFPARSIRPASGPDPNVSEYTAEKDKEHRENRDPLWKIIHPRWPKSADGQWFWKCDTSSDELDGHYFLYATYYDLVADTDEEKQRVRDVVTAITDHLIDHGYQLVDWDGQPTRWARFGPDLMNHDPDWADERGLNSLSMLSYLKTAWHMTQDGKYQKAYEDLINNHSYLMNMLVPKVHAGPGTGNQSDDEMAFMSFYNLIKYEENPKLRASYAGAMYRYFLIERPEKNPLFNYIYAAVCEGEKYPGPWGGADLSASREVLEEAADTLVRIPLDRIMWPHKNSHRLDIVPMAPHTQFDTHPNRGHLRNGYVIPVDERTFEFWNHDPWNLDYRNDGRVLADGEAFLLPYYMGLYHKFLAEE